MKSEEDQFTGLLRVARRLREHQARTENWKHRPIITCDLADVVAMSLYGKPSVSLVYAADGYDLWLDGNILLTGQTEDQAYEAMLHT